MSEQLPTTESVAAPHIGQGPRIFYFIQFASGGAFFPYLSLYYKSIGLGEQMNILLAATPVLLLVAAPMWGIVADKTRAHKQILVLALVGTMLMAFVMLHIRSFGPMLAAVIAFACLFAPIIPLIDNTTLELLGNRRDLYGRHRIGGTLGWMLSALVSGWMVDQMGLRWAFLGYILLAGLAVPAALRLPVHGGPMGLSLAAGVRAFVGNRRWILFLGAITTGGFGISLIHQYWAVHLDDLGYSRTFLGVTMLLMVATEIPVMLYASQIVRRYGPPRLLIVALLVMVVRLIGYSELHAAWQILGLQCLHGATFSLMWIAGVAHARAIAPEGMGATAQGLFSAAFSGIGVTLGALIGGGIYHAYDSNVMYRAGGLLVLGGAGLLGVSRMLYGRGKGRFGAAFFSGDDSR
ncbi:MAG TPA: major facilitator superfamily domain-containing protein 6 [Candidatus Sumerlaeota bacterium]|nr:major facilitator superfamily domain-containing protein 6 [Candidatus Sumerlaeota bacterium]